MSRSSSREGGRMGLAGYWAGAKEFIPDQMFGDEMVAMDTAIPNRGGYGGIVDSEARELNEMASYWFDRIREECERQDRDRLSLEERLHAREVAAYREYLKWLDRENQDQQQVDE